MPDFEECLREACVELNIQSTPYLIEKCLQIYEMLLVRHGIMIVGLPFSGKSSAYKALAKGLGLANKKVSNFSFDYCKFK